MSENIRIKSLKSRNQIKRDRTIFVVSFLALPIIGFLLFYVYVNLNSVLMAFHAVFPQA